MKIGAIIAGIFGLLLAVGSSAVIWHIMQPPGPVDRHLVYLAAGGIFFGALLIMPTIILSTLKQLLTMVGPYIPMIGGRRSTDPPAPPADPNPDKP